jgi:hypothetical protein
MTDTYLGLEGKLKCPENTIKKALKGLCKKSNQNVIGKPKKI